MFIFFKFDFAGVAVWEGLTPFFTKLWTWSVSINRPGMRGTAGSGGSEPSARVFQICTLPPLLRVSRKSVFAGVVWWDLSPPFGLAKETV